MLCLESWYYLLSFSRAVGTAITPPRFAKIYESSINIEEITGELVSSFNEIPSARCRRHYQIIERCNSALSRLHPFSVLLVLSDLSILPCPLLDYSNYIESPRYNLFVNYKCISYCASYILI